MEITINTTSYNERRYGKPWIAVVDYSTNRKGDFKFGDWVGKIGGEGECYVTAEPGDIIAHGQKDFRKPRNSAPDYYFVEADGTLTHIGDNPVAARKYQAEKLATIGSQVEED
jgi:hypothetical protein